MAVELIRQSSGPIGNELDSMMLARYGEDNGASKISAFNQPDGPSFSDFLDIINPLQHIPVVSTIYQAVTGDHQGAVSDVVGGILWGGPIGLVSAMADLAVQDGTGKSIGANVASLFTDGPDTDTVTATAAATAAVQAAPAADAPAPVPTAVEVAAIPTPVATPATPAPAGDLPMTVGDFMVFGASPPAGPATPPVGPPAPPTAPPAAAAQRPTASAAPPVIAGPATSGDFLVFGADSRPTSLLPSDDPPAQDHRFRPLPARTGPATPRAALPMPTTGPGAVPGGVSQSSVSQGGVSQGGDFVGKFSAALDKYQKASRLGEPADTVQLQ